MDCLRDKTFEFYGSMYYAVFSEICIDADVKAKISVTSRKNDLSDVFFKIGFMPYFLSSNSPLSSNYDRKKTLNSIFFSTFSRNNHVSPFFKEELPKKPQLHIFFKNNFRKNHITTFFHSIYWKNDTTPLFL